MWGSGAVVLTHGGGRDPKEHGGGHHNAVYPLALRKLLPLNVAGGDKEAYKDA